MTPRANLLDFDEARARLLAYATAPVAHEFLPLLQSLGRILAVAITSPIHVPGFDNSAMDGYALNVADIP